MPEEQGERPSARQFRCLVEGCRMEGVWQPIVPGEEFYADPKDRRSHYFVEHYLASEAAFAKLLADQREARMAHYRLTGEILRPQF